MSYLKAFSTHINSKIKDYFNNSSIQGLRYITEPNRHFTERIFWAAACISAMYGTYKLLMASWDNFQNNPVSFVVETSYLDWNTTFPAVTLCENESPDKIYDSGTKLFGEDRNMNLDFYLRDIAFFDGTCYSCKTHCGKSMNCTRDLNFLIQNVRSKCEQFFDSCMWNGEPFDCCNRFLPLQTETGLCYSINSMHTEQNEKNIKLISNQLTGPGRLDFQIYEAAKLFIHSRDDVPYINHPQGEKAVLNWGTISTLSFQVNEIENDPLLKDVSVEQRSCRFPEENTLDVYNFYSYSACVVDCRAKAQIQFCNCTHHFMPKLIGVETCNIEGLACLTEHSETLRALRTKENEKKGLVCDCMSSCIEPEYTVVAKTQAANDDYSQERSKVSVMMDTLPSQRFKRNVVRTRLDLVVSMGGTAGLFIGASLLSIAELFVFMLLRHKTNMKIVSQEKFDQKHEKEIPKKINILRTNNPSLLKAYNRNIHLNQNLYHRNFSHWSNFQYLS